MKIRLLFSVLILIPATVVHATPQELASKYISDAEVDAYPQALKNPVIVEPLADGTYAVKTDLFVSTCGIVKLEMKPVSSDEAVATLARLHKPDALPGSLSKIQYFMQEDLGGEITCYIENRETFVFFLASWRPLKGQISSVLASAKGAGCAHLLQNFKP